MRVSPVALFGGLGLAISLGVGVGLWLPWIQTVASLPSDELTTELVATDLAMFQTAAAEAADGDWTTVYSASGFSKAMEADLGRDVAVGGALFAYPPMVAQVLRPFVSMSLATAFWTWSAIVAGSLMVWWLAVRPSVPMGVYLAVSIPVFATVRLGQTSWLGLLVIVVALHQLRSDRLPVAGAVLGLLVVKPQYLIGVVVWLAIDRRMRKMAVPLVGVAGGIVALSFALSPDGWFAYSRNLIDLLFTERVTSRFDYSLISFSRGLTGTGGWLSWLIAAVVGAAVVALLYRWVTRLQPEPMPALSAATFASLLLSPHALVYDWILVLAPALVLWRFLVDRPAVLAAAGGVALGWSAGFLPVPDRVAAVLSYGLMVAGFAYAVHVSAPGAPTAEASTCATIREGRT